MIRGAVRDPTNEKKLAPLKEAYGADRFNLIEFVPFDLSDKESIAKALENVHTVVHTAHPLIEHGFTEEGMLECSRVSSEQIIEAALENKVKKIVLTSTHWTMAGTHQRYDTEPTHVYTEEDHVTAD